mgnify:CR=1 FL=1
MWDRWRRIEGAPCERFAKRRSQLRPVRASLRELGDPNDPSLAARLKSAHSGPKLIELAEQYQQMARVAYDAHDLDDCWLGAQISLQLLDSFTKNPDHAPRLAESAASCGRAKLATGNAVEAGAWLLKAGGYLAFAERVYNEIPFKLAAEMIDAKESLPVVEFLLRWRPGLARAAAARPAFLPRGSESEAQVSLWLFLLGRGLPPMIR